MLRKSQLGAIGSITLGTALAALAVSAVLATCASAVGGPVWVVKGAELAEGEKEAIESEGGQFMLTGSTNIVCEAEKDSGEILGGNPGRDLSTITFEKCHEESKTKCLAANLGEDSIQSTGKSVLVYPLGKAEASAEALDAFTPDTSGSTENIFVEFILKNASGSLECGILNNFKVEVKASGTLISDPSQINKQCGLLAQVGTLSSGAFAITKALEENLVGALDSTGSPEEATIWEPSKKTFGTIQCKLEAFGNALEKGISDVSLVSKATFGWNV